MADQGSASHITKPHFLQPVMSDIATNFSIPADFCKYFNPERCNIFQLRSSRRKQPWVVRIEGRRMADGWEEFVTKNELRVGEYVLFRYEGDMVFDVTVFHPTACKSESLPPVDDEPAPAVMVEEVCETLEFVTRKRQPYSSSRVGTSSFAGTMRPSYMKNLYFPITFVLKHELLRTNSGILIKDESGKTWPMELCVRRDSNVVYTKKRAWTTFVKENGIIEGDEFEIRIISKGITPVLAFHKISTIQMFEQGNTQSASAVAEPENTKTTTPKPFKKQKAEEEVPEQAMKGTCTPAKKKDPKSEEIPTTPAVTHGKRRIDSTSAESSTRFFCQTSTWPSLQQSRMNVNIEFARANDLLNRCGDIYLKNIQGESWAAKLRYKRVRSQDCYYIGAGWKDFALSNGLGVGCRFKMEIEKPESEVLTMKLCESVHEDLKP